MGGGGRGTGNGRRGVGWRVRTRIVQRKVKKDKIGKEGKEAKEGNK